MNNITIHRPDKIVAFEVGLKIINDGKETDITVIDISYRFGKATIKLSDKTKIVYHNFPVSYFK